MQISDIVRVDITRDTKTPTQAGFGTPLILGQHTRFTDRARVYNSMDDVAADFQATDKEYLAAQKIFSQNPAIPSIVIGRRVAAASQVETVSVASLVANGVYTLTINGVDYSYTADGTPTNNEIFTGLAAAVTDAHVALNAGASLTVSAVTPGVGFTIATSGNLSDVNTTPNGNVVSDIQAVRAVNDTWYVLILTSHTDADILAAAAYIETQVKLFGASSSDAGLLTNVNGNIGAQMKALSYDRTFLVYNETPDVSFPEAVWVGVTLPLAPGSITWKFKTGAGLAPSDTLTSNQLANLRASNVNFFSTFGGIPIFSDGIVASGEFIDIIHGTDLIQARIEEGVYGLLTSVGKVPFTNAGIDSVKLQVHAVLLNAIGLGILSDDPANAPTVTAPDVRAISKADKAARYLQNVKFTAVYAGAIHKVSIQGSISV